MAVAIQTIKLNKHFKRAYYRGASIAGGYLVLYYLENRTNENRLGITVSKKVGNAVIRNRIRRLIKESYRLKAADLKQGYDIVFVARTKAHGADYEAIKRDMSFLLKKSGLA